VALASWLAGAGGFASLVLLAAIVAASARLLLAVGDASEGRSDRWPVVMSVAGIVCGSDIVVVPSSVPFRSSLTRSYAMRSGALWRTAMVTSPDG
jgi:hypothetical protein